MTQYQLVLPDGETRTISPAGLRIGRGHDSNIRLDLPGVSRQHALVWIEGDRVFIRDERSTNGTFVNGVRLTPMQAQPLYPGDVVRIVTVTLGLAAVSKLAPPDAASDSADTPKAPAGWAPARPPLLAGRGKNAYLPILVGFSILLAAVLVVGGVWLATRGADRGPATKRAPVAPAVATPTRSVWAPTVKPRATPTLRQQVTPTSRAPATRTIAPAASFTPTPTATLTRTSAPARKPSPTSTLATCLPNAAYVNDVTVPDGTRFEPNESFNKVWRIRSNGCAPWPAGSRWAFVSGDKLGAPGAVDVPSTTPGNTADISVAMQAPSTPGTYTGYWQMQAPDGRPFGAKATVVIVVAAPDNRPTVAVLIVNRTGGTLYLTLSGPAEYSFTIASGNHTIWVVPGTYNYTGTGCGGASKSGIEVISYNTGNWDWWCS